MLMKNALPLCVCALLVFGLSACGGNQEDATSTKIKVESLDDLPRMVYPIEGSASELLVSDDFMAFAARVRAEQERLLDDYDIQDETTLQSIYGTMRRIDFLEGDYEAAVAWLDKSVALEDKEASRLTAGLSMRAWVAARDEVDPVDDPEAFSAAFSKHLTDMVEAMPWEVVQDDLEGTKGYAEYISENLILGSVQSELDPVVAKTGELTEDAARGLVGMRYTMAAFLPVKDEVAAVYKELIDANRVVKADIWAARAVTLDKNSGAQPVVIGIWDSGVDASVFKNLTVDQPERAPRRHRHRRQRLRGRRPRHRVRCLWPPDAGTSPPRGRHGGQGGQRHGLHEGIHGSRLRHRQPGGH